MQKELTITLEQDVYEGLYALIDPLQISRFIEDLIRPYVLYADLDEAYAQMAQDEERESDAFEWVEACIGDIDDETW
ncbi:MAG: addiction module antitoxin [Chloroflexota bacterium]